MDIARPRYELFDHTADLGVRVCAPSLPDLVRPATEAFYATIGEVVAGGDAVVREFEFSGDEPALLLRDYLAELLLIFEREHRRFTPTAVRDFTPGHLAVSGESLPLDVAASRFEREVKAVTYHELAIRAVAGGYEATYIVDI